MNIPDDVEQVVRRALQEDIGSGDISAHLIDAAAHGNWTLTLTSTGTLKKVTPYQSATSCARSVDRPGCC
jgi:nicotinate-nucleotide pyrophosphorylase